MITPKFITKVVPLSLAVASAVMSLSGCQKQQNDNKSPLSTQNTQVTTASATTQIANNEIQLLAADVITAKADRFEPSVTVTGTLQPSDHTVVQSTVNAQVQQVLADMGKTVAKGEPLVRHLISVIVKTNSRKRKPMLPPPKHKPSSPINLLSATKFCSSKALSHK